MEHDHTQTDPSSRTPLSTPYLVTIRVNGDPLRTTDRCVQATSAYHAGWLYRQLNPGAKLVAIRPVPQGR